MGWCTRVASGEVEWLHLRVGFGGCAGMVVYHRRAFGGCALGVTYHSSGNLWRLLLRGLGEILGGCAEALISGPFTVLFIYCRA